MSSTEFKLKGWVFKQSRFLKQWRKRYCVLTQDSILTFKNENINEKATEILKIKLCNGVKSAEDETKKQFSFRVDYSGEFFYFYVNSQLEKDKWVGLISKQIIAPNCKYLKQTFSDSGSSSDED